MRILVALTAAVLCACGNGSSEEPDDFGAAQTARTAVAADRVCAAAGFENLESCAESPDRNIRLGAKTALAMTETYLRMCSADLGSARCNDMLQAAYFAANAAVRHSL